MKNKKNKKRSKTERIIEKIFQTSKAMKNENGDWKRKEESEKISCI